MTDVTTTRLQRTIDVALAAGLVAGIAGFLIPFWKTWGCVPNALRLVGAVSWALVMLRPETRAALARHRRLGRIALVLALVGTAVLGWNMACCISGATICG